jgi:hypothetical protein
MADKNTKDSELVAAFPEFHLLLIYLLVRTNIIKAVCTNIFDFTFVC